MVTHATAEGYKAALPSRYTTIGFCACKSAVSQLFICGGLHPPLRHPTQVFFIADATCLPGAMTDAFLSAFGNVGSREELQRCVRLRI